MHRLSLPNSGAVAVLLAAEHMNQSNSLDGVQVVAALMAGTLFVVDAEASTGKVVEEQEKNTHYVDAEVDVITLAAILYRHLCSQVHLLAQLGSS